MNIAVIGAGKMGSWLAAELAKNNEVWVYSRTYAKSAQIPNARPIKNADEIQGLGLDMLVNAVSLENTISSFEEIVPMLPKTCMLADIASIKGDL